MCDGLRLLVVLGLIFQVGCERAIPLPFRHVVLFGVDGLQVRESTKNSPAAHAADARARPMFVH